MVIYILAYSIVARPCFALHAHVDNVLSHPRYKAMPIPVTCDGCGARFKAPDAAAGKKGKCKKCGAAIVVPVPAAAAESALEDDMYDLAAGPPPPLPKQPPPAPAYNPSPSPALSTSAAMMSRGVVPKSATAGSWKTSHEPPAIMKVLALLGGGFLILLGLLFVAGPVLAMMSDKTGKTFRFKGVFIGVALIVTGIGTIVKAFSKADE